jgi:Fe-S-cluster-containing dehydrogenase component
MPTSETEEFDRLIGDQLVTLGRSFDDLFSQGRIKLTIDGQEIEMNRIIRAYDAMDRRVPPRRTTVYDAVNELYRKSGAAQQGGAVNPADEALGANRPVPVLCHREHMRPAAVCRVCMVELKGAPRLVAACHQPIEPGMVVSTIRTSPRVQKATSVVTELLLADHQSPEGSWRQSGEDELKLLQHRFNLPGSRFASDGIDRGQDDSSPVISVDHNACILCDRCVRACNEVKENGVLARMNKGYSARIAFDLNDPMGESSCVACGECMISCPTGALSNRMVINVELDQKPAGEQRRSSGEIVEPQYLLQHPLFKDISLPFLVWNRNAILRRTYKKGDVVCREGEFGATAFIIESGKFDVHINSAKGGAAAKPSGGVLSWFRKSAAASPGAGAHASGTPRSDSHAALVNEGDRWTAQLSREDLIFGEMACMNQYPRSATITAASDDCQVLEILRNVLYMLQRTQASKEKLDQLYRERSLDTHLRKVPLFENLPPGVFAAVLEFLKQRVKLIRAHPSQVIFREGDRADHFYMVRIGFVKVSRRSSGGERVANYIGPDEFFGEIGLLAQIPEIQRALEVSDIRTATCTALDHVDLVRIDGEDFHWLLRAFLLDRTVLEKVADPFKPLFQRLLDEVARADRSANVADRIVQTARERLEQNRASQGRIESAPLEDFLQQGLMEASNLLVLDLEKCTRCDECVKACADIHHDPVPGNHVTRLIRDGLRFDKYLVASSCRSCLDPYCMVGCPVGSIQRNLDGTILIRDWCIGCGLCERNCPYGNITMHETTGRATAERVAVTCDYCASADGVARCVYACPHDAAHRMKGSELLQIVGAQNHGS